MSRAESIGEWLRFVTPIMIVLIGFLGNMAINDIKEGMKMLNMHFTNHLSDHRQVEVLLEQRLTRLETKMDGCLR